MFMFQTKTDISIIRPHTHRLVHYYAVSREADCSVSVRIFPNWNMDSTLVNIGIIVYIFCVKKTTATTKQKKTPQSLYVWDF